MPIHHAPTHRYQTPVGRWPGAGRATVPGRFDPRSAGTAGFHRPAGGPGATPTFERHPFPRGVCTELQTPQPHRAMPTKGYRKQRQTDCPHELDAAPQTCLRHRHRDLPGAPAKPAWRFARLRARSLASVPISACGGKLRVIACIEDPPLICKILEHIQRCEAIASITARP